MPVMNVLLAILWLIGVPLLIGGSLVEGYLILFALLEALALPAIFFKLPLHALSSLYALLLLMIGAWRVAGRWGAVKPAKSGSSQDTIPGILRRIGSGDFVLLAAVALILFQAVFLCLFVHMDADDSFFVSAALTDAATDTVFQYSPYTGMAYEILPWRYTLSPFPVFLAVMSRLCGGLHPAVFAHVVIPPVLYLLVPGVLWRLGRLLHPEEKGGASWFLLFALLMIQFSAWSIFNAGIFVLLRIWQGKAILAGVLLPLLLWCGLSAILKEDTEEKPPWRTLWLAGISCCLVSSMGIVLCPVMLGLLTAAALISRCRVRTALRILSGAVPPVLLGILYLVLW